MRTLPITKAKELPVDHINFWWDFAGKVGAPIFAATLVACLLSSKLSFHHGLLVMTGLVMMGLAHWREHHFKGDKDKTH